MAPEKLGDRPGPCILRGPRRPPHAHDWDLRQSPVAPQGQLELAEKALQSGNNQVARELFTKLAENNDPVAQCWLAHMSERGSKFPVTRRGRSSCTRRRLRETSLPRSFASARYRITFWGVMLFNTLVTTGTFQALVGQLLGFPRCFCRPSIRWVPRSASRLHRRLRASGFRPPSSCATKGR
jgi:hypothetical protein